jgi:hypothetical protein
MELFKKAAPVLNPETRSRRRSPRSITFYEEGKCSMGERKDFQIPSYLESEQITFRWEIAFLSTLISRSRMVEERGIFLMAFSIIIGPLFLQG